ncbi:metal ABC transporter substrate-binding protein [Spirilliplanes yamanashiensis]|uniref:Zinc ABC transporter substrate-binding protein n=1 Tax=Spirilliplanes yamanashiensis TaxID=42233 RepID=A0A8J4DLJ8_9ACTN|nr:metal ABC transporter substrate-binding protein [Spirilliplanes yamanashiensis]MDP9816544.1 zinc transport system substrate-binding protein [Spirilliplanes yamanashiensis]GIJ06071.1 zinc ABC transporter substrate-binding protein [Spirilliplanes yamanashiensis]
MLKRCTALLAAAGLALTTTACGGSEPARADDKLAVVAAFYPLEYLAKRIGGDAVTVTGLAKPGAEPHDLELTLNQVSQVADADLVVYLRGFQPAVDEAVEGQAADHAFDAAAVAPLLDAAAGGHEHEGEAAGEEAHAEEEAGPDPHLWLDPARLADVGDALAKRLAEVDGSQDFAGRARALRADLTTLDGEFTAGLKTCERREIVTSHAAFGYLAARYQLEQVAITGLSPESEPSIQRLTTVAGEAREHGATTIFFETLVSPDVAKTIADKVGARTAVLDPLEGLQPGAAGDYLSVMRTNLSTLKSALGCS